MAMVRQFGSSTDAVFPSSEDAEGGRVLRALQGLAESDNTVEGICSLECSKYLRFVI